MYQKKRLSAILLMSGSGERFSSNIPKQFSYLSGQKIYLHTLNAFLRINLFDEIILVCHEDWIEQVKEETSSYPSVQVIKGGTTRQQSSFLGIQKAHCDIVVIHDAARPFVSEKIILENIENAIKHKAVDTCIPSTDTIIHSKDLFQINDIPLRKNYLRGQTPQSFEYNVIYNAHKTTTLKNSTDDCSIALQAGHKIFIVNGSEFNIKITNKLDLFIAEQLFRLNTTKIIHKKNVSLKNKTYVVIGGSGGIGKFVCSLLLKENATAIPLSRSTIPSLDLTNFNSIKEVFKKIFQEYNHIDGIINCAGLFLVKPFQQMEEEEIKNIISINFTGLVYCCHQANIKNGGHIINISSSSCFKGRKLYGVYSASKAAIINFTQALSEEMLHLNINAIVPQRTNTPMRKKNFPLENPSLLLDPKIVAKKIIEVLKEKNLTGTIIEIKKD